MARTFRRDHVCRLVEPAKGHLCHLVMGPDCQARMSVMLIHPTPTSPHPSQARPLTFIQWTTARQTSLLTIPAHASQIYSAQFSPHTPTSLLTCASDGFVKVFDTRSPTRAALEFRASDTEVLDVDWNKYEDGVVASASKDLGVRVWDLRAGGRCTAELVGHSLAVRKVQ
jgi:WD40 repeat protein